MFTMKTELKTKKRLNITLSRGTWLTLKEEVPRMQRSFFIDQALKAYLADKKKAEIKEALIKEALENQKEDLEIVNEWSSVDQENWYQIY